MLQTVLLLLLAGLQAQETRPPQQPSPPRGTQPQPPRPPESLVAKILRLTGITVTPGGLRDAEPTIPGDVWLADPLGARAITTSGSYHTPIVLPGGQRLLALDGESVVQLDLAGNISSARITIPGVMRLIGTTSEAASEILVLMKGPALARLNLMTGTLDTNDLDGLTPDLAFELQRNDSRRYGDLRLISRQVRTRERGLQVDASIISVDRNGTSTELARCSEAICDQPSSTPDGNPVVFVRRP